MPIPQQVRITGVSQLRGTIRPPGDKSISHRALLLSALAGGTSRLWGLADGVDVAHTRAAVAALGATVEIGPDAEVRVTGGQLREPASVIDTGNSGTGIRLLAGLAAGIPGLTVLHGDESVAQRPMDRVVTPLRLMGARIHGRDGGRLAPLAIIGGRLSGIEYELPVASAQVKSAVLLAALAAEGPTVVRERLPSRAHTEEMLATRGADIQVADGVITLHPSTLSPRDETIPADPSQAAFWIAGAAAIPGSSVTVQGVYRGTARGGFLDVLRRMGADLQVVAEDVQTSSYTIRVLGRELHATDIEPEEVPSLVDEVPILAVAAALAEGTTRIRGAEELRYKETDRIRSTAGLLCAFGATVEQHPDGMTITGAGALQPAVVDSGGDHRIAMAAAIAAVAADGPTVIHGMDAAQTSYPGFLADLSACAPGVTED